MENYPQVAKWGVSRESYMGLEFSFQQSPMVLASCPLGPADRCHWTIHSKFKALEGCSCAFPQVDTAIASESHSSNQLSKPFLKQPVPAEGTGTQLE
jgi:hypothetical protein